MWVEVLQQRDWDLDVDLGSTAPSKIEETFAFFSPVAAHQILSDKGKSLDAKGRKMHVKRVAGLATQEKATLNPSHAMHAL